MQNNQSVKERKMAKKWDHDEWCDKCEATVDAIVVDGWIICDNCDARLFEVSPS